MDALKIDKSNLRMYRLPAGSLFSIAAPRLYLSFHFLCYLAENRWTITPESLAGFTGIRNRQPALFVGCAMNRFVEKAKELENQGVELIKYQFTDIQGNDREKTISVSGIKDDGMTTTDGSSLFGKIIPPTESDMLLIPDPETLSIIPWSQDAARVFCDLYYPPDSENSPPKLFEGCPRNILKRAEASMLEVLAEHVNRLHPGKIEQLHAHFAPEIEFILLDEDYDVERIHLDDKLTNKNYFVPPSEKTDRALKRMIKLMGEMGLRKEMYHTEVTSYQCEIGFHYGNALKIADGTKTLKHIIRKVAEQEGLKASFIPKFREGVNGSGMHVHQSLAATVDGVVYNLFYDQSKEDCFSDIGRMYTTGLLTHSREITAITNPTPVSYKRLVPDREAPTRVSFGWLNRTALCRGHSKGTKKIRVEYRAPDPTANIYNAFAAMLSAGLEGIANGYELAEPDKRNLYYDHDGVDELPGNLGEALDLMNNSEMLRRRMGDFIISTIFSLGKAEWRSYIQEVSDSDIRRYW